MGWSGNLTVGQWTHVAYTYDPSSGTAVVYKDGLPATTSAVGTLNTWGEDTSLRPLPFRVGSQNEDNGDPTSGLRGSLTIAKLRVYDRSLSAQAIADIVRTEGRVFLPTISSVSVDPVSKAVTLSWNAVGGLSYTVETSSNLLDWSVLANGVTTGLYTDSQAAPVAPVRYYRLRTE